MQYNIKINYSLYTLFYLILYLRPPILSQHQFCLVLSKYKSKYLKARCWQRTLVVKNYELTEDEFFYFDFIKNDENIHVSFHKIYMSAVEMESLAMFSWRHRHAWAIQVSKYLRKNNISFVRLSALDFLKINPFHEKLENDGWKDAFVSLSTSNLGDSPTHRLSVFKDDEENSVLGENSNLTYSKWKSYCITSFYYLLLYYISYEIHCL